LKYLLCARPWLPAIDYCCACFLVQPMANLRSRIRRLDRSRIASREDTLRPGWNPVDDDRRFVRKLWIPASPFPVGNTVTLPYIGLQDLTQGWQAGNSLDSDFMTLNVSWVNATSPTPPTITVTGVASPGTDFTMKSGDQLSVWVCNPQSGNCAATSGSAISTPAGPYLPNLAVALALFPQSQVIAPYVTLSIDGKPAGSLFGVGNSTGWMTLGIGAHTVSASVPADTSGLYKVSYSAACNAKGIVTLNEGDNRTCDIEVMSSLALKSTGCATDETCCEAGVTRCSLCMRLPANGSCP